MKQVKGISQFRNDRIYFYEIYSQYFFIGIVLHAPKEELSIAEDISLQSDDGHGMDIETNNASGCIDENVDGEYERNDNDNNENDIYMNNENEEFCAPHNHENEAHILLNLEQQTHNINNCCLSCRKILLMLLKKNG
ncbi:PREDICTED: uncharacterized protein LOC105570142 [Vollenhovia emeryi]|uniref:uncharacterized protein LOC105570142 n=1 Tax=Vollenhovia emeryi TaxID=411798 RepID=UPI0005F45861|nr:PREDICTED: uncharacterized protein LOC105570142 [Vollenhovia emeryi]